VLRQKLQSQHALHEQQLEDKRVSLREFQQSFKTSIKKFGNECYENKLRMMMQMFSLTSRQLELPFATLEPSPQG